MLVTQRNGEAPGRGCGCVDGGARGWGRSGKEPPPDATRAGREGRVALASGGKHLEINSVIVGH